MGRDAPERKRIPALAGDLPGWMGYPGGAMLPPEQSGERSWHRFRPGWSWIGHVWKSTPEQDYEALAALLRGMLPEDGVAIEIGAHGGQVTRLLADLLPHGHVLAVEPGSHARSVLRTKLLLHPRRNLFVAMGYGIASLVPDPGRTPVPEPLPDGADGDWLFRAAG